MSPKTLLLVEDNLSDADLARRAFERSRVPSALVVVEDGEQALDYLFGEGSFSGREKDDPVLVLLDLKLPKIDGLEVLRRIRADDRTRRIPVVALTSSAEDGDLAASYDLGVNSYIRKPVDFGQFVQAFQSLCLYWLTLNEPPPRTRAR